MAPENPRIEELRRRVQLDPASIAFAQLAEECRRIGSYEEAVEICRNGLASHPDYLSARITLGRALIELGSLDEAKHELDVVVSHAPENLPAIRGLAEIFQRKGNLNESLSYFRRALTLARHDVELVENVDRISQRIEVPVAPPPAAPAPPVSVEELFDFDKLLLELGEEPQKLEDTPAPLIAAPVVVPEPTPAPPLPDDDFADMERELRAMDEQRARDEEAARLAREEEAARAAHAQEVARLAREEELARLAREEESARALEEQRERDEQERLARELQERLAREEEELLARLAREEEELRVREEEQRLAEEASRAEGVRRAEEQRREEEARRVEEELARERAEFDAQRRRDEEQRLRDDAERERLAEEARQAAEQQRQRAVLAELEHWLDAIVSDRDHHASP